MVTFRTHDSVLRASKSNNHAPHHYGFEASVPGHIAAIARADAGVRGQTGSFLLRLLELRHEMLTISRRPAGFAQYNNTCYCILNGLQFDLKVKAIVRFEMEPYKKNQAERHTYRATLRLKKALLPMIVDVSKNAYLISIMVR